MTVALFGPLAYKILARNIKSINRLGSPKHFQVSTGDGEGGQRKIEFSDGYYQNEQVPIETSGVIFRPHA